MNRIGMRINMPVIKTDKLTKIYGSKLKALDNLSISIDEGEVFGLLGPNGAGKTNLIRLDSRTRSLLSGLE
jgi:ABC-type multidrug transport system ATPase subunit